MLSVYHCVHAVPRTIIRAASFLSVQFEDTFLFFPQMAAFFRRTVTIMVSLSRSEMMACRQASRGTFPVPDRFLFMIIVSVSPLFFSFCSMDRQLVSNLDAAGKVTQAFPGGVSVWGQIQKIGSHRGSMQEGYPPI